MYVRCKTRHCITYNRSRFYRQDQNRTIIIVGTPCVYTVPYSSVCYNKGLYTLLKGFLTIFSIREDRLLYDGDDIERWETPTSGRKLNAIELRCQGTPGGECKGVGMWIILTDDKSDAGGLLMLEWDPKEAENGRVNAVSN